MRPNSNETKYHDNKQPDNYVSEWEREETRDAETEKKAQKFPGLALPDEKYPAKIVSEEVINPHNNTRGSSRRGRSRSRELNERRYDRYDRRELRDSRDSSERDSRDSRDRNDRHYHDSSSKFYRNASYEHSWAHVR